MDNLDEIWAGFDLKSYTPNTITSIDKMRDELKTILKNGYAYDNEEQELDIICIAAPVFNNLGTVNYAVSVSVPKNRFSEEKEEPKCPECGYTPFYKRCMSCGHERKSVNLVEHQPGEMREVMIGKRKLADDQRHLWEQVCAYARGHSSPEKQAGRAWYLFKDMTGQEPPRTWKFETTPNVPVTKAVANFILSKNIAFAKKKQSVAA